VKNKFVLLLWILAVLFPIGETWVPFFIINSTRSHPLSLQDELFPLIFSSLFVAAPFVIIAIISKNRMRRKPKNKKAVIISGFIVIILYSALLGWFLFDAFTRKTGGANIGGALLIMSSSFLVPVIMLAAYQILKSK
jgi:hypothetical protein